MNGRSYTVAGVMPDGFADPLAGSVDAWVPGNLSPGRDLANVDNHYLSVIARLRPDVTIARAQAELDRLSKTLAERYPRRAVRGRAGSTRSRRISSAAPAQPLEIMLGAVALVLVLICVNLANLLLVRGSDRAREFALRSALGAERPAPRQADADREPDAGASPATSPGIVVARFRRCRRSSRSAPGSIPRLSIADAGATAARVLAGHCVAERAGIRAAPALRAARTQPGDVLREQSRSATSGGVQMRATAVARGVAGRARVRAARRRRPADRELPADPGGPAWRQAGRRADVRAAFA